MDSRISVTSKALEPGQVTSMCVTTAVVFVLMDWLEQYFDTPTLTILLCICSAGSSQAMVQKDTTMCLLPSTAEGGRMFRLVRHGAKGGKAGMDPNRSFLRSTG